MISSDEEEKEKFSLVATPWHNIGARLLISFVPTERRRRSEARFAHCQLDLPFPGALKMLLGAINIKLHKNLAPLARSQSLRYLFLAFFSPKPVVTDNDVRL